MTTTKKSRSVASLALALALGLTGLMTGCGAGGPTELTVAEIEAQVQEDIEAFSGKYDDKKVTVTGYYAGQRGLDPALGASADASASGGESFVVTCEGVNADDLTEGDPVTVTGTLYAILADHVALTSASVVE